MAEKHSKPQEFYFVRNIDGITDPNLKWGVWVQNVGVDNQKRIIGEVLNGGWIGKFTPTTCYVEATDTTVEGKVCWIGKVPLPFSSNYNDAIEWIINQIKEREENDVS